MYQMPYFKESDSEAIMEFVRSHPFAFLIGVDAKAAPVTTQVPMFIDERDGRLYLSGHIMRNTDHHKAFKQNPQALVVFTGPHTYVSPSWYSNPRQGGTWNYMSVHARGEIRFLDEAALRSVLQRTTDHFEANPDSGANYKDLPPEYVDKYVKAIEAFEIEVQSMEHTFKLSQNRDEESYHNIIKKLKEKGGDAALIAAEMEKRQPAGKKEY